MRTHSLLAAFAITMASAATSVAQPAWPNRNITIIVPFAAGGSTDIAARLMGEKLGADLGQSIVVENRPGAGSNIGAAAAAKAAPDGYTVLLATSTLAANVSLYKNMGFSLQKDLIPVSQLTIIPNVLTINNDVPAKSIAEFTAHARARKPSLNFGSSGNGASQHLAAELFKRMAQVDMVHVPYRGGSQANSDLLAGHIQVVFSPLVEVLPFIESGKLRALAVTTKARTPRLPALPTVAETLPGFEIVLWNGFFVPTGTPQAVVERLNASIRKVMADSVIAKQVADQGSSVVAGSPAEFKAVVDADIAKLADLIKTAGIKID